MPYLCVWAYAMYELILSLSLVVCIALHSHLADLFTPFSAVHKLGPVLDTPELVFLAGPFCAGDFVS